MSNAALLPAQDLGAFLRELQTQSPTQAGRDRLAAMRAEPTIRTVGGAYFVTRWIEVCDILARNRAFQVLYQPAMDPSVGPFMLARDSEVENWRDKSVMRTVLRWEDLPAIRAGAGRIAQAALPNASQGDVDIIATLSRLVPLRIVQECFGFHAGDAEMLRWSYAMQHSMFRNPGRERQVWQAGVGAGIEMRAWLRTFLNGRQPWTAAAGGDAISRLLRLTAAGLSGLETEQVVSNVCGLLVGSIETTSQAIACATYEILSRPDIRAQAIQAAKDDDTTVLDGLVFEALRFRPITVVMARVCKEETVLAPGTPRATPVTQGSLVFAVTGSAMHDESVFPAPDTFLVRPRDPYTTFGFGPHECLGRYVAEQIVPETVRRILRLPDVRLHPGDSGDFGMGPTSPFPESFVVAFGP